MKPGGDTPANTGLGKSSSNLLFLELEEQIDRARSVRPVTVRAYLLRVSLADRSAADRHPDMAQASFFETVDDSLHIGHRCGQESAHPDDVGFVLARGGLEFVQRLVHADIDDLEPGALRHHAN